MPSTEGLDGESEGRKGGIEVQLGLRIVYGVRTAAM